MTTKTKENQENQENLFRLEISPKGNSEYIKTIILRKTKNPKHNSDPEKLKNQLIHDIKEVDSIKFLSPPVKKYEDAKKRGTKICFRYHFDNSKNSWNANNNQEMDTRIIKRSVYIEHDEWSNTDSVEDVFYLENIKEDSPTPIRSVKLATEFFRDKLRAFDWIGRELV